MNEIIWALLAIDVLEKVSCILKVIIAITFVATFACVSAYFFFIDYFYDREETFKPFKKAFKPVGTTLIISLFIYTLIPSKQTMQIALGLYATNQVVTYAADTDIAKQALSTLELKLKSIEQDLKKEMEEQNSGK